MKKISFTIIIIVLCLVALYINYFMEKYSAIGGGCILLMGILSIIRDNTHKSDE